MRVNAPAEAALAAVLEVTPAEMPLVRALFRLRGLPARRDRPRLTDARSRRRFRAYWLVVRPFSGLVRRSWLAAARRRAEAP